MPKLLRFLAVNAVMGVALGLILLGMLLVTDTANLRTLIWTSSNPAVALLLLAMGLCVTFGSVFIGSAVMLMPYDGKLPYDDED
jgi:succinate dehydrogenase hydrophobic anchor subunit